MNTPINRATNKWWTSKKKSNKKQSLKPINKLYSKCTVKTLTKAQRDLNKLCTIWDKKLRVNLSDFCNTRTHPWYFPYRKYRRGSNRCKICGAKLGKVKCVWKRRPEILMDNLCSPTPLWSMLNKKGKDESKDI